MEDGVNYSELFISEELKWVETVSDKIIETSTEMFKKKLGSKRTEAAKDGDISVAEQTK